MTIIGTAVLLAVVAIVIVTGRHSTRSASADSGTAAPSATAPAAPPVLDDRGLHPPLVGISGWLQSNVTSLEQLKGKVVAVQFWTFSCANCKATLPHMQDLYKKYQAQGLEIVGVHAPEFDFEAKPDNIVAAAKDLGVTWPIALDPTRASFHGWQGGQAFWPRLYLLDRNGHIRYDHIGEGGYAATDAAVRALLAEPPS
jgi:thiol-disulfide isomerase/thioredoxin